MLPPNHKPRDPHAEANARCAALILADVARYGGESSLMAQWARLVRGNS